MKPVAKCPRCGINKNSPFPCECAVDCTCDNGRIVQAYDVQHHENVLDQLEADKAAK